MIITNDAFFPLMLSQWQGTITPQDIERHSHVSRAVIDRCKRESRQQVWIIQNTADLSVPARSRSAASDLFNGYSAEDIATGTAMYTVIDSAVLRGVIVAWKWVTRAEFMSKLHVKASVPAAIEAAQHDLRLTGQAEPDWDAVRGWFRHVLAVRSGDPERPVSL